MEHTGPRKAKSLTLKPWSGAYWTTEGQEPKLKKVNSDTSQDCNLPIKIYLQADDLKPQALARMILKASSTG